MKLSHRLAAIKAARDKIDNSNPQAPPALPPAPGEAVFNLATPATSSPGENGSLPKLSFAGYSGQPVQLRDYGVEYPMIYSVKGIEYKNSVPILYEHWEPIGHSTTINKTETNLSGEGIPSFPSEKTQTIIQALKNGFPFEASMGLRIPNKEDITFLQKGEKRVVNNREVTGPMYVAERAVLKEMTITMSGRDSNTSFGLLNKEAITMLLNSANPGQVPPAVPPATHPAPALTLPNSDPAPTPTPAPAVVPPAPAPAAVNNSVPPAPAPATSSIGRTDLVKLNRLLNSYPDHTEKIEAGYEAGQSFEAIENSIKLELFNNGLPRVPNLTPGKKSEENQSILANFALSCGVKPETLEKAGLDKKVVENAEKGQRWSFVETLLNIANANNGNRRYTGFSDIEAVCKEVKNSNQRAFLDIDNASYSQVDMPNLLKKTTEMMLEERWAINPPFATRYLKEESNKDFRITQRIRPGGGKIWDSVGRDGKLEMTEFGPETEYRSKLDTIGQMVVFNREQIYNDDMGVISDMLAAMVEGALIVPDQKLGRMMLVQAAAAGTFWVNADNSRTSLALNRENLKTAYNAVRQYNENRGRNFVNVINDRWTLITSLTNEDVAYDLLNQNRVVQETGAANGTRTGDKNFWFGKLDHAVFPQMSNTSLLNNGAASTFVSEGTWLLWPSSQRFSPYTITYLRGMRRPTVEAVDLPGNMLGAGWRGYWDIEINEREREATLRANG
jgi:hypothetical protein